MNDTLNPSQIGDIVELKCQLYLIENGWNVLVPIGNHQKYDLVIEKDNSFYRIQCKHSSKTDRGFLVRTKYEIRDSGKLIQKTYTNKDCDYFMTEFENKFYIFPVWGTSETHFWLVKPRIKTCKFAEDYIANRVLTGLQSPSGLFIE